GSMLSALQATGTPISDIEVPSKPRINIADANDMVVAGTAPQLTISGVGDSPDPFTPLARRKKKVRISWELSQYATKVTVGIYKRSGKLVTMLVKRDLGLGRWYVDWNGKARGRVVKAATYNYIIRATDDDGRTFQKKGKTTLKR
ncbi:MAG: hypothetical protein ABI571_05755, partial [Actinomycetota bacterium]